MEADKEVDDGADKDAVTGSKRGNDRGGKGRSVCVGEADGPVRHLISSSAGTAPTTNDGRRGRTRKREHNEKAVCWFQSETSAMEKEQVSVHIPVGISPSAPRNEVDTSSISWLSCLAQRRKPTRMQNALYIQGEGYRPSGVSDQGQSKSSLR